MIEKPLVSQLISKPVSFSESRKFITMSGIL